MTITQWHVPVDDENCYWYAIFTSYTAPVDKKKMREQRLELYELPDYKSRKNKTNDYGFDPHEQATATYTGMGADINVHDQWAVESMGAIQDRTNEHLGTARQGDRAVSPPAAAGDREGRRRREADAVPRRRPCAQHPGPGHHGRHRADPGWEIYWMEVDVKRRRGAPWAAPVPRRSPTRSGISRRRSDSGIVIASDGDRSIRQAKRIRIASRIDRFASPRNDG